jgi:hypothetical protein
MFQPKFDAHLDPQVKAKWLTALRSRKFKQGKGALLSVNRELDGTYSNPQYCCLGVLAEVIGNVACFNMEDAYLPNKEATVLFHCDITTAEKLQAHLAVRNDGGTDWDNQNPKGNVYKAPEHGLKFYQIARWIERNL